jgi:hypothetical protein
MEEKTFVGSAGIVGIERIDMDEYIESILFDNEILSSQVEQLEKLVVEYRKQLKELKFESEKDKFHLESVLSHNKAFHDNKEGE